MGNTIKAMSPGRTEPCGKLCGYNGKFKREGGSRERGHRVKAGLLTTGCADRQSFSGTTKKIKGGKQMTDFRG